MERFTLLFDLDGTLTDPKEGIVRCIRFALDGLGVVHDVQQSLDGCIGPPLRESFARLLGGERAHLVPQAIDLYRRRFGDVGWLENRPYEGIRECLERLGSGHDLLVATAKPTIFAERILSHFGLRPFFRAVYGSELDGTNAEKDDLLRTILDREGIAPGRALMIGDREHDMRGACANGVLGIGAAWGYGSERELLDSGAVAIVRQPADLPPLVRSLGGGRTERLAAR